MFIVSRSALRAAIFAACAIVGTGDAAAQAPARVTVRVALLATPGTIHMAYPMARENGMFAKQGLEVEFLSVDATPAALAAIVSGSAQFAFTGSNLPDAVVAGLPVVAVHASTNLPVAEICAHRSIATIKDLAGKSIAVTNRGSSPDATLRIWLEKQGFKEGEVTVRNVDAGVPAIVAAVVAGTAQAWALNPPRCLQYDANGLRPLADLGAIGTEFFNGGIAVSRDYLAANRAVVQRFVAALVEARRLFQDNKDVAIALIKALEKIDNQAMAESVWAFWKTHLANPPLVSSEAMLQAIRYSMNPTTRERGPALLSRMYDNSIVEEAIGK